MKRYFHHKHPPAAERLDIWGARCALPRGAWAAGATFAHMADLLLCAAAWAKLDWNEELGMIVDIDNNAESLSDFAEARACSPSDISDCQELSPQPKRKREDTDIVDIEEIRKSKNGGIYVKRRADGRYLTHVVLPKIVKNDIRRSFPQMFCNAENSHDPQLMGTFMRQFASEDMSLHNVCHEVPGCGEDCVRRFSIHGVEEAALFWTRLGEMMPDKTSRVLDAQVRARSDGTGMVECVLELQGTVVVRPDEPPPWQWMDECYGGSGGLNKFMETLAMIRAQSHSDAMHSLVLGSLTLVSMKSTAKVKFHLDASNTVRWVDFEKAPPSVEVSFA